MNDQPDPNFAEWRARVLAARLEQHIDDFLAHEGNRDEVRFALEMLRLKIVEGRADGNTG
jgi:hypothetical protein